jgi:hypothetical protein
MSDITKPTDISMVNDVPPMPQFSEHQHGPYIVTEWKYGRYSPTGVGFVSRSGSDANYAKATRVRCATCLKETEL